LTLIIIVDPVQPDRNAASALSKEKFEVFKEKAKEFLENPDEDFFIIKKLDKSFIKKKGKKNKVFILKTVPLKGKQDVIGAKIMKAYKFIIKNLKKHEFKLIDNGWEFDKKKSLLYFILKDEKLSDKMIIQGPPVKVKKNAEDFKSKHKKVFEKNKRLYAEEKREFREAKKLLKSLIKNKYIKERVKRINI